jgi:hypothetical protein
MAFIGFSFLLEQPMIVNLPTQQIGPQIGHLQTHLGTESRPQLGQGYCIHSTPPVAADSVNLPPL